jgi:DNA-binding CsgD family transcriptional regulator
VELRVTQFELLTKARRDAIERIAQVVGEQAFTGLVGEAEVGKTAILTAALDVLRKDGWAVVRLDLDGAWSPNRLAWRWARELVRATAGSVVLSHIDALDSGMWPESTRAALLRLHGELGDDVARLAEARHPARGVGKADAIDAPVNATLELAGNRRLVLAVDHLEAPKAAGLGTPDAAELLWRVRSRGQYLSNLRVVVCARPPAQDLASGSEAAYHMGGRWLTLDPPSATAFAAVTDRDIAVVEAAIERTFGHPRATLEILGELPGLWRDAPMAVDDSIGRVAARHVDLARHCVQHARSVHRLGGHLLIAVAQGRGPYEATPEIDGTEVSQAMTRLHLNGLVRRLGPREWAPCDPRVGWVLGGTLRKHVESAHRSADVSTARGEPNRASGGRMNLTARELTPREKEILALVAAGYTNEDISETLEISTNTVKYHLRGIYQALGVSSRIQAAAVAARK